MRTDSQLGYEKRAVTVSQDSLAKFTQPLMSERRIPSTFQDEGTLHPAVSPTGTTAAASGQGSPPPTGPFGSWQFVCADCHNLITVLACMAGYFQCANCCAPQNLAEAWAKRCQPTVGSMYPTTVLCPDDGVAVTFCSKEDGHQEFCDHCQSSFTLDRQNVAVTFTRSEETVASDEGLGAASFQVSLWPPKPGVAPLPGGFERFFGTFVKTTVHSCGATIVTEPSDQTQSLFCDCGAFLRGPTEAAEALKILCGICLNVETVAPSASGPVWCSICDALAGAAEAAVTDAALVRVLCLAIGSVDRYSSCSCGASVIGPKGLGGGVVACGDCPGVVPFAPVAMPVFALGAFGGNAFADIPAGHVKQKPPVHWDPAKHKWVEDPPPAPGSPHPLSPPTVRGPCPEPVDYRPPGYNDAFWEWDDKHCCWVISVSGRPKQWHYPNGQSTERDPALDDPPTIDPGPAHGGIDRDRDMPPDGSDQGTGGGPTEFPLIDDIDKLIPPLSRPIWVDEPCIPHYVMLWDVLINSYGTKNTFNVQGPMNELQGLTTTVTPYFQTGVFITVSFDVVRVMNFDYSWTQHDIYLEYWTDMCGHHWSTTHDRRRIIRGGHGQTILGMWPFTSKAYYFDYAGPPLAPGALATATQGQLDAAETAAAKAAGF